jgi:hypothetical protein
MRKRIAFLAALAAIVAAPAAQADVSTTAALDCDERLERLEAQFYNLADHRGYEGATEWWDQRWQVYFRHCIVG